MIERILKLLSDSGLTAKKLTADIGISSSAISEWKKGKGKPSAEAIVKLANYFNVSTDYILIGITGKNGIVLSQRENELITNYRNLNKDGMAYIDSQMNIANQIYKQNEYVKEIEEDELKHKKNSKLG